MRPKAVAGIIAGVTSLALQTSVARSAPQPVAVTLARDGRAAATIVVADDPTCAAQFAAAELQYHIARITGAVLPVAGAREVVEGVRVLVGESKATAALGLPGQPWQPQEYLIRVLPEMIVLMGQDADRKTKVQYGEEQPEAYLTWPDLFEAQGTCYAVYDFLERCCGVRWFRPGELGMMHPVTATLEVRGESIRRAPAFKYRHPYPLLLPGQRYDYRTGLWWSAADGQAKCAEVEAIAYPELAGKSVHARTALVRLFLHRMRLGGEPYHCNHSYYGYYDRFWARNPKKPDVFEGAHPEWFAQGYGQKPSPIKEEGKTYPKTYYEKPPQMCFTNEAFIQQVVRDARNYFDGKGVAPGSRAVGDYFPLVPMDNRLWCKCAACQAFLKPEAERGRNQFSNDQASDYVYAFVNRVAREVKTTHPDKFLATAAYANYAYPPEREQLEANVSIQFALHARMVYSPAVQDNDRKILAAWAAEGQDRRSLLWLYYLFPVYSGQLGKFHCFPGAFAHSIDEAFKTFHRYGVRGAFFEGMGQDVEAYVTFKLMDEPGLDVDALLEEYFTGMYGAAASPMKTLYLRLEQIYSNPANYPAAAHHQTAEIAWGCLGTQERMAELGALMAQAQTLATAAADGARVQLFGKQIWEYMTAGREMYLVRQAASIPSIKAPSLTAAGGDPDQVDWSRAVSLRQWHKQEGGPAQRKLEVRLAHDGSWLYMQLVEWVDPKTLKIDTASVWSGDDWELFFAKQRAKPYRQLGLGPAGTSQGLAHGESAGARMAEWDSGALVRADISAPDCWTTRVALPLAKLVPGGLVPGDRLYMNIVRIWWVHNRGFQVVWSPLSGVHQPDRFAEVTLE